MTPQMMKENERLKEENERLRKIVWTMPIDPTRPEPSRLEIAAMAMQGILSNAMGADLSPQQCEEMLGLDRYVYHLHYPQVCALYALNFADALLAAAKGGE